MSGQDVVVTFKPSGRTVHVARGTRLVEAAMAAGLTLDMPCGGEGVCGKCRVVIHEGAAGPGEAEQTAIAAADLAHGVRLACQTSVDTEMTVEVPETSLLSVHHQIFSQSVGDSGPCADPIVTKRYVELPPPARGDDLADLDRLRRALGDCPNFRPSENGTVPLTSPFTTDLDLLRQLPRRLRETEFRGTAVLVGDRLLDFEPGNTESESLAVAVDLGTTTLVAALVDLTTGDELAVASRLNPQTAYGDDVLSRILYAQESDDNLGRLHALVVGAIDEMIGELAESAGANRQRIYEVALAGNTTMQHLACRIDPRYLGELPFTAATARHVATEAVRLGLHIHPRGRAYVLPTIGGFVGGDTVAGLLATGIADVTRPTLLIDIGTNGEIVLAAGGAIWAAAAAAGPAFEGARIQHGMRGATGAIERVTVDGVLHAGVIGGGRPRGICGSGLIDLAAELLQHEIISPEGRFREPGDLTGDVPPDVRRRVLSKKTNDGQAAFLVAEAADTAIGRSIVVTQRDVRQLQLASGAIRAGVLLLLRRAGLEVSDVDRVLLAGGFGNFIRRSRALRIGLLPQGIAHERISYQGNTSLAGARLVAISRSARRRAEELAARTAHIDLSTDHAFQWTFADAMIFPSE